MKRNILLSFLLVLLSTLTLHQTAQAANFCVDNTGDGPSTPANCPIDCVGPTGNCTVRDAVDAADANPGPDIVTIPPNTYTLSDTGEGHITIDETVTINGGGEATTIIQWVNPDRTQRDRIFENNDNVTGTIIQDLTIQGGSHDGSGGGIQNDGKAGITLNNVTIQDCETRGTDIDGGGFANETGATAELNNVTIIGNRSTESDGGGVFAASDGRVIIRNSTVSGNFAMSDGGGIDNRGLMFIENSTIDGNRTTDRGAGIRSTGPLFVTNSTVSRNIQEPSVGPGPTGDITGCGGGIFAPSFNFGLINSTVSENSSTHAGGGICFETDISGSVVGSGLGPPSLFNVTIADNVVTGPNGMGGGISCEDCFNGSAIGPQGSNPMIANTLIAQNTAAMGPDCAGFYVSADFNLIGDLDNPNICSGFIDGVDNDQVGGNGNPVIDPIITALQNNGGPTETNGLLPGSPAIDMANDVEGCEAPNFEDLINLMFTIEDLTIDQRGFPRPIAVLDPSAPICDIGAFEYQVFSFELTKTDDTGGVDVPVGDNFNYIITVTNNGPGTASNVTLDDPLPSNVDFVSVTPSQGACAAIGDVIGCDLGDLAQGETATVTVTVLAVTAGTFTNTVTLILENPSQETLTQIAEVTTTIGSFFVFGSGFHCGLSSVAPALGSLKGMAVLLLLSAGGITLLRRKVS